MLLTVAMADDYYRLLGVARDAPPSEIKKAFRRLARETHPDANPDDPAAEERFRRAAEAYEVLSDPEKRARYDRGDDFDLAGLFQGVGIEDLLRSVFGEGGAFGGSIFGGGGWSGNQGRGRDIRVRLALDLEEAAFGAAKTVRFRAADLCPECSGSGARPGTGPVTCGACAGSGQVRTARQSFLGSMMTLVPCRTCGGAGSLIAAPCRRCRGSGAAEAEREVQVDVPKGVDDGNRMRLDGEGEAGLRGAPPGDLFVELAVRPHEYFIRRGDDLIYELEIGIAAAALGTRVEAPLLGGGSERVEIPAGTGHGDVIRLKGRGAGRLRRRGRGDLLLLVGVEVPSRLSRAERQCLRRYAEMRGEDVL